LRLRGICSCGCGGGDGDGLCGGELGVFLLLLLGACKGVGLEVGGAGLLLLFVDDGTAEVDLGVYWGWGGVGLRE
jgi:hypothetical protein